VKAAIDELRDRRLIEGTAPNLSLTAAGCDALTRLIDARRAHLEDLAEDWDPVRNPEIVGYLQRTAREIVPDVERRTAAA